MFISALLHSISLTFSALSLKLPSPKHLLHTYARGFNAHKSGQIYEENLKQQRF